MKQGKRLAVHLAASTIPVLACVASCTGGPIQGGWFGGSGLISGNGNGDGGVGDGAQDSSLPANDDGGGTSTSSITVTGHVVNDLGAAVANATLIVESHDVGTTDATGAFSFSGTATAGSNVILSSTGTGLGPAVTVIPVKTGVTQYVVPITMPRMQTQAINASSTTTMTVPMLGQNVTIRIPGGSVPTGSTLHVAAYDPSVSLPPGKMAPSGDPTSGLRTDGMFYYSVVDGTGTEIATPPMGVEVTIPGSNLAAIPDSQPFNQWQLGSDGTWTNPVVTAQPTSTTPVTLSPTAFGFWNSDHAYKTACVTGTLSASGSACGGARVQALGLDNLSSFDSSGADGSFCVTGAQTRSSRLVVGTASRSVAMPASAGDCSIPTSCEDIGTIMVTADQCQGAEGEEDAGTATGACGLPGVSATATLASVAGPTTTLFGNGTSYPPGAYSVVYVDGTYETNSTSEWGVVNVPYSDGCTIVFSGSGSPALPPYGANQISTAAYEAANAGTSITIQHQGGTIGIAFADTQYTDNVAGSPLPTFKLQCP